MTPSPYKEGPSPFMAWYRSLQNYRYFALAAAVIGMTTLITALAALDSEGAALRGVTPEAGEEWSSLSPRGISDEIEKVVRGYLEAPSIEARLPYLRRPQAVHPLMTDHAQRHHFHPVSVTAVHLVATLDATQRE